MDKLETLRDKIESSIIFPVGIMEMPKERISGTGFFPCANGTYDNTTDISSRKILVLGQDQDDERGFADSIKNKKETDSLTWTKIKYLFESSGVDFNDCFFTNCFMGIRMNVDTNTGKSPGFYHESFLNQNIDFLAYQLNLIRPKAIICLGREPLNFLKKSNDDIRSEYKGLDSFKKIDQKRLGFFGNVKFDKSDELLADLVVLMHPSSRKFNRDKRIIDGKSGDLAEIELLKQMLGRL